MREGRERGRGEEEMRDGLVRGERERKRVKRR